jgi:hypothetical protein
MNTRYQLIVGGIGAGIDVGVAILAASEKMPWPLDPDTAMPSASWRAIMVAIHKAKQPDPDLPHHRVRIKSVGPYIRTKTLRESMMGTPWEGILLDIEGAKASGDPEPPATPTITDLILAAENGKARRRQDIEGASPPTATPKWVDDWFIWRLRD